MRDGLISFLPETGSVPDYHFYRWRSADPRGVNASTPVVVTRKTKQEQKVDEETTAEETAKEATREDQRHRQYIYLSQ